LIYVLMINGPTAFPLFIPLIPQLFLIFYGFRNFDVWMFLGNKSSYYFLSISILILSIYFVSLFKLDYELAIRLAKFFCNSIFCIMAAISLVKLYGANFPEVYTNAISFFSSLGIMGLCLTTITDWNLTATIGERIYHTNLLTVWLTDGDYNSSLVSFSPFKYRLQSFFDEPGSFGILLLPAFYYAIYKRRISIIIILSLSIFLTESASAWLGAIILMLFFFMTEAGLGERILIFILSLLFVLFFSSDLILLYEIKTGIDEAYSNSSSYDTRLKDYQFILNYMMDRIAPLSGDSYISSGISASYVQWIIFGGLAFFILLVESLVFVFLIFKKIALSSMEKNYFPFILSFVIYMAGYQRSSFIDNVLFMTLFYWTIFYLFNSDEEMG
jgi:hypothetical protein